MGPDLIVARPRPATLEDALREVVANAPYLMVALLLHLALLLVFLRGDLAPTVIEETRVIQASAEAPVTEIDPPKPPEPIELEPDTTVVEDPIDSLVPLDDLTPVISDVPTDLPSTSAGTDVGPASILGAGPGHAGGPGGPGGPRGDRGGNPTDENVRLGLNWLAHHQAPDGSWSAEGFDLQCGQLGQDTLCDGRGLPRHDVGVTGLALLAFLGAGHSTRHGEHRDVVRQGVRWLAQVQQQDGSLAIAPGSHGVYDHIIATLALCEAYHLARSVHLRAPAEAGLAFMATLRAPASGWRYGPRHASAADPARAADTSVTGWALLTLATAEKAGLPVDRDAVADGLAFLDEMTDRETGRTGYIARGQGSSREVGAEEAWPVEQSEAMTAVAVLCRVFFDPDLEVPGQREIIERGADLIAALPPTWEQPGRRDFYFWYYGAYALYQLGGPRWRAWERAIEDTLMTHQHREGERAGSWDPQGDPWGHAGGRVYTTALNTLTLEVYYRYDTLLGR